MAQFSVKIMRLTGSVLGENQHLKADNVRPCLLQPLEKGADPSVDPVDVKCRDFHLLPTDKRETGSRLTLTRTRARVKM